MKTYRLDPAKLPAQKKTLTLVYGITFLVMAALSIGINWNRDSMKSLVWMIPLIAALFVYSGLRAYKQRKELWEEYTFQVSEDGLVLHQPKYPELKLSKADIREIEDVKAGAIDLMRRASLEVEGLEWLRVLYCYPDGTDKALIDEMAAHENICRYLDLPL